MQAVDYIVKKAEELRMPVSINISFGNTYGSHNGTSLPERFLDAAAETGRTLISVGTGNEGAEAGHASGFLREGEERNIPLAVQERQGAFSFRSGRIIQMSLEWPFRLLPGRESVPSGK